MTNSWKAVLTGDIVASTKLKPDRRKDLYNIFPELSEKLRTEYPQDILYKISNFRGDSWQLIVERPEKSFEISLYIRTFIRFSFREEKLDSRIAIGIGSINFIPTENISAGDGPAYRTSGSLLESLPPSKRGSKSVDTSDHRYGPANRLSGSLFDTLASSRMALEFADFDNSNIITKQGAKCLISLLDYIITSWGIGQSQAVFWALHTSKQSDIAQKWIPTPIKQSSVSRSLKTAGWEHIKLGKDYFEELIKSLEN